MKKMIFSLTFVSGLLFGYVEPNENPGANCDLGVTINGNYSKAAALNTAMKTFTDAGLPGVAIATYTEAEGWWTSAQGYANIDNKTPMQACHLQYIQSVTKSYMAVEILQLKEKGKIKLDDPITKYLPAKYSKHIKDAGKITVRMLLNHKSGIPEYSTDPGFVSVVIEHPLSYFDLEDCLKHISGNDLLFTPGSKYLYTNTNYLLLSLIGDVITGDHVAYMKKNIFKPLDLNNSYYGNNHNYLNGLNVPESYWDVLNTGKPANISRFQQVNVASLKGDDGIVCTPVDAVKFLKGLMEGKLLNEESMKEMFDFVKDEKGDKKYGMGMFYFDLAGLPAYGHGGGGVGAGCGLLYIPSHKTYVFFGTNLGVLAESDLVKKADELRNTIIGTLLQ